MIKYIYIHVIDAKIHPNLHQLCTPKKMRIKPLTKTSYPSISKNCFLSIWTLWRASSTLGGHRSIFSCSPRARWIPSTTLGLGCFQAGRWKWLTAWLAVFRSAMIQGAQCLYTILAPGKKMAIDCVPLHAISSLQNHTESAMKVGLLCSVFQRTKTKHSQHVSTNMLHQLKEVRNTSKHRH